MGDTARLETRILQAPGEEPFIFIRASITSSCSMLGHSSRPSTMMRTDLDDIINFSIMAPKCCFDGFRPLLANVSSTYGASSVFAASSWVAKLRSTSTDEL